MKSQSENVTSRLLRTVIEDLLCVSLVIVAAAAVNPYPYFGAAYPGQPPLTIAR